jgi:hypothetical protein
MARRKRNRPGGIPTKRVLDHFGSPQGVARFFQIKDKAVYQWGRTIPIQRELELMLKLPDVFGRQPPA